MVSKRQASQQLDELFCEFIFGCIFSRDEILPVFLERLLPVFLERHLLSAMTLTP
jgi:hypothetical protein